MEKNITFYQLNLQNLSFRFCLKIPIDLFFSCLAVPENVALIKTIYSHLFLKQIMEKKRSVILHCFFSTKLSTKNSGIATSLIFNTIIKYLDKDIYVSPYLLILTTRHLSQYTVKREIGSIIYNIHNKSGKVSLNLLPYSTFYWLQKILWLIHLDECSEVNMSPKNFRKRSLFIYSVKEESCFLKARLNH